MSGGRPNHSIACSIVRERDGEIYEQIQSNTSDIWQIVLMTKFNAKIVLLVQLRHPFFMCIRSFDSLQLHLIFIQLKTLAPLHPCFNYLMCSWKLPKLF